VYIFKDGKFVKDDGVKGKKTTVKKDKQEDES
jgi:hypothetical protein